MSATISRRADSPNDARQRRGMEERRVVTVLFCDVAGSSFLAEQLGPEDWAEVMQEAFEAFIQPVERYGGTIGRLMGDAILAFFGAPTAHEDDPQRAILAGLAIVDAIQPLRERVRRTWGYDFNVRIGINTGMLVVGDFGSRDWFEYTAMGDAINLAAKIQQEGQPGAVQVATATWRLTEPLFDFEPGGEIEFGGAGRREQVYRVLRQRDVAGKLWDVAGLGAPLVGRSAELKLIQRAYDELFEGRGHIIFLVGEAGLGKSRLLDELRRYWQESGRQAEVGWLENRLISYEASLPYGSLQARFRKSFGIERNDSPEVVHAKLNRILEPFPAKMRSRAIAVVERALSIGTDGVLPASAPGDEQAAQEFRRELHSVTVELLRNWNRGGPLVFISDDQHWSDAASADILANAFQLVEQMPILFVCAMRPETHRPIWKTREYALTNFAEQSSELRLRSLADADSRQLLEAFLGEGDETCPFKSLILERAEGNPLFVEEIIRSLIDRGLLERCGEPDEFCWQPVQGANLNTLVIPESLQGLFQERVDRLEPEPRRVLQQASVIGRMFFRSVLADLTESDDTLDQALERLVQADLVREVARTPEPEYAFRHALILETVYQTIPRRRRQEFHRLAAEASEQVFAARLDEQAGRIGRHYFEATDERAIPWLVRAAEQAQRVYEPDAVIELLTQAEDLASRLDLPLPPGAGILRGHAHELTGDYDAARDDFEWALERAREASDRLAEWQALVGLGMAWVERDYARAGESFEAALALARKLGDDALLAHSLNRLGNWYANQEEPQRGIEAHTEALDIFQRLGNETGVAETLDLLGIAHFLVGDLAASHSAYDQAIASFTRLGDRRGLASSLAMSILGAGSSQSVTIDPPNVSLQELNLDGARALEITREIGWQAGEAFSHFVLASALEVRGEFESARHHADSGLRIAESIEHRQWILANHVAIGTLELNAGHPARAREHLEQGLAIAEEISSVHWRRSVSGMLASALVADGDVTRAAEVVNDVITLDAAASSLARREACYHRAVVQLASGDAAGALATLEGIRQAPARDRRTSVHVNLLMGRCLAKLGRLVEAESALAAARARAEELRFLPALDEIDQALAALPSQAHLLV